MQLPLDGAPVLPQDLKTAAPFEHAGFEVEENVDLPGTEGVTAGDAAHDLHKEAAEAVEHEFEILEFVGHLEWLSAGLGRDFRRWRGD